MNHPHDLVWAWRVFVPRNLKCKVVIVVHDPNTAKDTVRSIPRGQGESEHCGLYLQLESFNGDTYFLSQGWHDGIPRDYPTASVGAPIQPSSLRKMLQHRTNWTTQIGGEDSTVVSDLSKRVQILRILPRSATNNQSQNKKIDVPSITVYLERAK